MTARTAVGQWVARHPMIAAGGFMSGIFLLVGIAASLAFIPNLIVWHAAAKWPSTEAEITSATLTSTGTRRVVRPDFIFRYTWEGKIHTTHGYDLLDVYSTDLNHAQAVLREHPVGSRAKVLVNPAKPAQAVITRGDTPGLILYTLPSLFTVLGLIGALFTTAAALGWLDENSRHPVGRGVRAVGAVVLQEKVLKPLFFVIIAVVVIGLIALGLLNDSPVLYVIAGIIAWGVWIAARKPKGSSDAGDSDA